MKTEKNKICEKKSGQEPDGEFSELVDNRDNAIQYKVVRNGLIEQPLDKQFEKNTDKSKPEHGNDIAFELFYKEFTEGLVFDF